MVERLPSGHAVVKTPLRNPLNLAEERMNREAVVREAEIYQHLTSRGDDGNEVNDGAMIPRFLGWDAEECTLTLESQANGDLATYMRGNDGVSGVSLETRGKWAVQAAKALTSLHDRRVVHADVAPRNFLLNGSLDLCICDFAGSLLPGGPVETGAPGSRHQAGSWGRGHVPTYADDVFALGSVIYFIVTGSEAYAGLADHEAERRFRDADFPETEGVMLGSVVGDCWRGRFVNSGEVVRALEECGK